MPLSDRKGHFIFFYHRCGMEEYRSRHEDPPKKVEVNIKSYLMQLTKYTTIYPKKFHFNIF